MKTLIVTLVPNAFKLTLVGGTQAKVDFVKRYVTYYVVNDRDEVKPVDADFPFKAIADYYRGEGYEVEVLALAPLSLSVYLKQPSEDVYHLRKDVENLVVSNFKDVFDNVYVMPAVGTFRFTASGIPQYHNSNVGTIRFIAYKAVKDRVHAFNPDTVVLDTSSVSGPYSPAVQEAVELAVTEGAFTMDREIDLVHMSAEPFDEYSATARIYFGVAAGKVTPTGAMRYAFRVEKLGRAGDKTLELKGRSAFNELATSVEQCAPLYFATRVNELDLSQLYLDETLEAMVWDNARITKTTEFVVDYGVKLQKGAVIYSLTRSVLDSLKKRLGDPPYSLEDLEVVLRLFSDYCRSRFAEEARKALELAELTGLEELRLDQVRDALRTELGEAIHLVKESKWRDLIPEKKAKCEELEWEDMGLVGPAVMLYKGGKMAYGEQCWRAVNKAFREAFGLSSD
mgnify:CR=1 FL=1